MSVRVDWDGMDAFKAALRQLPEDLAKEGEAIVYAHANEAERLIIAAYPEGPTGNLKRRVKTTSDGSRFGASATVRSAAPHSHLFERGTQPRRTSTGANRGRMPEAPPNQQMIPIVIRVRRRMVMALIALVQRAGFVVTSS